MSRQTVKSHQRNTIFPGRKVGCTAQSTTDRIRGDLADPGKKYTSRYVIPASALHSAMPASHEPRRQEPCVRKNAHKYGLLSPACTRHALSPPPHLALGCNGQRPKITGRELLLPLRRHRRRETFLHARRPEADGCDQVCGC